MTDEPRHRDYGYTASEAISFFPGELPIDAVGMFQIVPAGRDSFGLKGADLIDFVRRSILALLDAGAIPVRGGGGTEYYWIKQPQYGIEKGEIADAVVQEWLSMPDDPLVLCGDGVWFARPRSDNSNYVKLD